MVWYFSISAIITNGIPLIRNITSRVNSYFFSEKKDFVAEEANQFVISPNIPNKIASKAPIIAVRIVNIIKYSLYPSDIDQRKARKFLGGFTGGDLG